MFYLRPAARPGPSRPIQDFPAHPDKQNFQPGPGRAAKKRSWPIFCSWAGPGRKVDGPGRASGFGRSCHSVLHRCHKKCHDNLSSDIYVTMLNTTKQKDFPLKSFGEKHVNIMLWHAIYKWMLMESMYLKKDMHWSNLSFPRCGTSRIIGNRAVNKVYGVRKNDNVFSLLFFNSAVEIPPKKLVALDIYCFQRCKIY